MPANYRQLLSLYDQKPEDIREFFENLRPLVENYEWGVSVSYVFTRLETAKHRTLHGGMVRLHATESALTRQMLDKDHMTRGRFKDLFKTVFGKPVPTTMLRTLSAAESLRDRVVHGKNVIDADARRGIADALNFAETFNEFVYAEAKFRPFGSMQGFVGRRQSLSKATTHWVLKGMGIPTATQREAAER